MLTFNYRAKSFLQCVIAGLAFCVAGLPAFAQNAPATKNQATVTIEVLFEALNDGRWQEADAIAATFDAKADDKTLLSTFARATQMVANGDCKSGLPMEIGRAHV